jgi:hypothetical protein
MKKYDLAIWFLAGLALFLIWARISSGFTSDDEEWIRKTRQALSEGKTYRQVFTQLSDAGYGDVYARKIYEAASNNK